MSDYAGVLESADEQQMPPASTDDAGDRAIALSRFQNSGLVKSVYPGGGGTLHVSQMQNMSFLLG